MHSRRVLCAAPSYIDRCGEPQNFQELNGHNCLRIAENSKRNIWVQDGPDNRPGFEAQGTFEGSNTDVIFRAALAGIGIARLPCYMADQKFQSGELVHIMPDYSTASTDIVVMFADRRNLAPKIRAFVDFLVAEFRDSTERSDNDGVIARPEMKAS